MSPYFMSPNVTATLEKHEQENTIDQSHMWTFMQKKKKKKNPKENWHIKPINLRTKVFQE